MAQLNSKNLNNLDLNRLVLENAFKNVELSQDTIGNKLQIGPGYSSQDVHDQASNFVKTVVQNDGQYKASEKKAYSYSTKILYLFLMGAAELLGPLTSHMIVPSLKSISSDLGTSYSKASITITVFLIAIGIGPLIWAMLSDAYGRKWFTVASMIIFALGSLGCALSTNIKMLVAMRFFQGLGSSASMVIGIGVISEIFPNSEKGRAIGAFSAGPLLSPILGPIIGGYMSQYVGWRSLFYLSTILGTGLAVLVTIFYKETMNTSRKLPAPITRNNETGKLEFSKSLPNPFSCLLFMKHVDVVLLCIWTGIIYSAYQAISISQPIALGALHRLSTSQVGLTYIAIGVGNIIGATGTGYISDYFVNRYSSKHNGQASPPELRLKVTFIGAIVIIAAVLMNGWFMNYRLPLPAILFAQFLIGLSMNCMNCGISSYYVESFPTKSSSVYACNTAIRVVFTSITSAITTPILNKIGPGYTFTFYASLEFIGLLILIYMLSFGPKIRSITRS
ncbi:MFS general substrate transporter [Conidiobolus coronatus NRRL 28638]|uniref:MFS general substrate transporter n=1 Tax=Conidiobolus coronatus (strain ATCC 28846 / CBS 209.66 / NRRL 28638) TaxID=796925 RepID=A0A137P7V0_CONC2|nr:MFS general substrate transporter [Conidiobolus coronatus NRRL 28638]|eukprot:KXN71075.1 MFS general substrate transporter [Conidiobolus coronatus NRRL 28638]